MSTVEEGGLVLPVDFSSPNKTQLYILAGFLGAGKTTLLNNFLTLLDGHKVGIVINEFGAVGIDRNRVKADNHLPIVELNNGQIFCSCLAGSFVESILSLLAKQPEYIVVESSGLAEPAPLMQIINQIKLKTGESFVYRGMVAVVDLQTYQVLSRAVYALNEQLRYSDAFLLNKSDLVDKVISTNIHHELQKLNPKAKIWETSFCRIDPSILELTPIASVPFSNPVSSQGPILRLTLRQEKNLTHQALLGFLQQVSPFVQRIKGILQLSNEIVEVDTVGQSIKVTPVKKDWMNREANYCLSVLDERNGDQALAVCHAWETVQGQRR